MYGFNESNRTMNIDTPLVTPEELLKVCKELEDNEAPTDEIELHIQSAHTYLYYRLDGRGIDTKLMTLIETYMAAHFAVLSYPAIEREALAGMSMKYFGRVDLGLNATRYGQMAIEMDPTGMLDTDRKQAVIAKSIGSGGAVRSAMVAAR